MNKLVETIFDIGMYDGADTEYYISLGFKVVAVEANPDLAARIRRKLSAQLATGQLECVNAAITPDGKPVQLALSAALGSSSIFSDRIVHKSPQGKVTVPGVTLNQLFERYGVPKFLKVDIEGADRFCVLSLQPDTMPAYLSFEIGNDIIELLHHTRAIGYKKYKVINQNTFREIANLNCLYDWVAQRVMWRLGFADPRELKRAGRFFVAGHSSGPVPWRSDGVWRSFDGVMAVLNKEKLSGWNDILAAVE